MVVNLPNSFPAVKLLEKEGFYVLNSTKKEVNDLPVLKIGILNLMPLKIETEADLLRLFYNVPFQVDITWVKLRSHTPKNTPKEHMDQYYVYFDEITQCAFDGFVITGAPVENMPFEAVHYWKELEEVFMWAKAHIPSTLYICWAAQAGLYYHYGIDKVALPQKLFGVFPHHVLDWSCPLFRGYDDVFYVPHSRHTSVELENIIACPSLDLLSESEEAGAYIMMSKNRRALFITGHSEYAPMALDAEYRRDKNKGLPISIPVNYYKNNDPDNKPLVRWRAHSNLLFSNWLNYYVYQQVQIDKE